MARNSAQASKWAGRKGTTGIIPNYPTGRFFSAYNYLTAWICRKHVRSLFPSCLVVSRVIEKGKVALDQPGKGVSLWTMKHNCPFYSGLEARAGREKFLPECLLPMQGEMKCHTNYLGSGQCEENWLQLHEAAARAPITKWGWGGFFVLLAVHSAVTLHTTDPSTHGVMRCGCSMMGSGLHSGATKAFRPESALAFKTQSHFGGIQDQLPWRRWNCMSAADIWTAIELGVMPGCTKSCAMLQCCFGGGRKKK